MFPMHLFKDTRMYYLASHMSTHIKLALIVGTVLSVVLDMALMFKFLGFLPKLKLESQIDFCL